MPISRTKKEEILEDLKAEFAGAAGAVFTDFRGVDVAGMTELRTKLRGEGSRYLVAKRTLAERALADAPPEQLNALLAGATGIAFFGEDSVAVAKVLVDFRKDYESFVVKGGILRGEFVTGEKITLIARTPPREVLLATLFAAMKSPHTSLVFLGKGLLRQFVATLAAVAEKRQAEEGAGEAA
jgi:large subunit ribosomal protein L10